MITRAIRFVGGLLLVTALAVAALAGAPASAAADLCDGGGREIFITVCP